MEWHDIIADLGMRQADRDDLPVYQGEGGHGSFLAKPAPMVASGGS
jgi:hypothetical protein